MPARTSSTIICGLEAQLSEVTTNAGDLSANRTLSVDAGGIDTTELADDAATNAKLAEMANFRLPEDLPYRELRSLSTEARQKLERVQPQSLAQAGRIPGVSPSDLQNLVLEVVRRRRSAA